MKTPIEAIDVGPLVSYSERKKACKCDCYESELLGHALPFLEILLEASKEKEASKYMELKTLIETIKPFQFKKYPDGCGSPF